MAAISKRQAEAAHRALLARYAFMFAATDGEPPLLGEADKPTLIKDWHGDGQGHWVIAWDSGPYEWAYRASMGGIDPEMAEAGREFGFEPKEEEPVPMPRGVFCEPVNICVLGLYPA